MKIIFSVLIALFFSQTVLSQSLDDKLSKKRMLHDWNIFKEIRKDANSGLYKYRSKEDTDSVYQWVEAEIEKSKTFRDFYNIICQVTDFEGSVHNNTKMPAKTYKAMKNENQGYFPYPIKLIEGKIVVNFEQGKIPLASEIISINGEKMELILANLYKYYTTDGGNITGKFVLINYSFAKLYRLHYGLQNSFEVVYKLPKHSKTIKKVIKSSSYSAYFGNAKKRYSAPFDKVVYKDWEINEMYSFKKINDSTATLTVNSFAIGSNEDAQEHKIYLKFLASIFIKVKEDKIKNLIVDVRYNGGGTDPNDLVTYSYLADREFSENKQAWVSFRKIPYLKYIKTKIPVVLRPIGILFTGYNKYFREDFPIKKDGRFYQDASSSDHKIRKPNKNAFTGKVFLLISPRMASAGTLFAAMLAGNKNVTVIGEETMGGYYGHNGHTPLTYVLPKSKIETTFSVVNLEQDVPKKENQKYNRGIIPDYEVKQSFEDFLKHTDTQMNFTLDLIRKKK